MNIFFKNYLELFICYDRFLSFIKFLSIKRDTENTMSDLYFNEERKWLFWIITSDNGPFHSTILQPFQLEPEQKKIFCTFFQVGVFKNLANFTGKHLCYSLFLIKLKGNTFFYRTSWRLLSESTHIHASASDLSITY